MTISETQSATAALLDVCGDGCGWTAAILGALAYGTYGVPIRDTKHIPVHPFVLQTYKTVTVFCMSWLVLFLRVKPAWTPWGLLSGLLWVLGGTAGVYAIRMAGLTIAVGTWASVMIAVNFVWGILIFKEPVADIFGTTCAFCLIAIGLVGMSYFSAPSKKYKVEYDEDEENENDRNNDTPNSNNNDGGLGQKDVELSPIVVHQETHSVNCSQPYARDDGEKFSASVAAVSGLFFSAQNKSNDIVLWNGRTVTKRTAGIIGAVCNGIFTGSTLIPLHYAKAHGFGGAHYMISFSTGALIALVSLWLLFFLSRFQTSIWQTYQTQMPDWHFQQLAVPGVCAGVLIFVAMFSSILAVSSLGQGIGNSVVQLKILISGLWGIFYFREIRGCGTIAGWLVSASISVSGILWSSHERLHAKQEEASGNHR
mmetsp:Transcript_20241/g.26110  ORF Transcript_20241/g.26110 Transcript_20241/m.26110 type:complete len:425 (+) Transcript_20241:146-1420(+)|eukprot:CAMPEP_0198149704 /NCGR_PEP_ID=MMETSP1443-20131203/47860_1 /TAXON_ID=186043 /ORGANISM="Entomoneis sp., Strain CCMP2396" /LENGTH=424 /DNA_ID=CAMNT_0043814817 /DNA_START=123 /DNA_END=1397 /DNA_ORIENTATION=+